MFRGGEIGLKAHIGIFHCKTMKIYPTTMLMEGWNQENMETNGNLEMVVSKL
jgi:hypothetical protein